MASPKKKWLRMKAKEDAARAEKAQKTSTPVEPEVLVSEVNDAADIELDTDNDSKAKIKEQIKELDQKAQKASTTKRTRKSRSVLGRKLKKN